MTAGAAEASAPHCSRAGCRSPATFRLSWRNPKIHAGDRGKIWLACADHVDYLNGFLQARNFPVAVEALEEPVVTADIEDRRG